MDLLDSLIDACRETSSGPDPVDTVLSLVSASALDELLVTVRTRPKPWLFAAGPDLSVFGTAGRAGSGSAPHVHGLWAVIASLAGTEGSRRYEEHNGSLVETGMERLDSGEARALPAAAIHAVFNGWSEPNVVLHIHGPDFLAAHKRVWDPLTGSCWSLGLAETLATADQR